MNYFARCKIIIRCSLRIWIKEINLEICIWLAIYYFKYDFVVWKENDALTGKSHYFFFFKVVTWEHSQPVRTWRVTCENYYWLEWRSVIPKVQFVVGSDGPPGGNYRYLLSRSDGHRVPDRNVLIIHCFFEESRWKNTSISLTYI